MENHVQGEYEVGQSTQQTALAQLLLVLAEGVARDEVGDDAQTHVVEAAEETVLEFGTGGFSHGDGCGGRCLQGRGKL